MSIKNQIKEKYNLYLTPTQIEDITFQINKILKDIKFNQNQDDFVLLLLIRSQISSDIDNYFFM